MGGREACGRPRGARAAAGRAAECKTRWRQRDARAVAAGRKGGRGACGRQQSVRPTAGRAGGRCASGNAGGGSGARERPLGVRARNERVAQATVENVG